MSYMRSEARSRQILDCAKRVFAERGFHGASISDVCALAGIGRGTLYQYYANKRALLTAILRETLHRVHALVEARSSRTARYPPPDQVTRAQAIAFEAGVLRELFATVFFDEHTLRILLREAVGLDVEIEQLLTEIDDALIAIVERDLIAARRAGYMREMDTRAVATMIVGGIEKLAVTALRGDVPVDLDRLATEATRLHAIGVMSDRLKPD